MYKIMVTETNLVGFPQITFVGNDNQATDNADSLMTFKTKSQAIDWCLSDEAMEWKNPYTCVEFEAVKC